MRHRMGGGAASFTVGAQVVQFLCALLHMLAHGDRLRSGRCRWALRGAAKAVAGPVGGPGEARTTHITGRQACAQRSPPPTSRAPP